MKYKAMSDIGNSRNVNEDFLAAEVVYSAQGKLGIFAVADGMGGHKKGEVASRIAVEKSVEYLKRSFKSMGSNVDSEIVGEILKSYDYSNDAIFKESHENEDCSGMGTTLTLAIISNKRMYVGNVGDSRCYILKGKNLQRITNDNSLVQELVFKGLITEDEAREHPQRNIITRAVGIDRPLKVDIYEREVREGDKVILATDGLTNMLSLEEMREVVHNFDNIEQSCEELVKRAKDGGGSDNISLIQILI